MQMEPVKATAPAPARYEGFHGQSISGTWRPGREGSMEVDTNAHPNGREPARLARELFAAQAKDCEQLETQIDEVDVQLMARHRADECSQRLAKIPGIGPIGATLLTMKTPAPELFRSGRQFAAWIGLTPRDHSTAGKVRLGVITRAGDEGLRSVLVVGATAVIQHARRSGKASPWLGALLKRKSPKLAAVALANKMARIAWKMMLTGEAYTATPAPAAVAGAV